MIVSVFRYYLKCKFVSDYLGGWETAIAILPAATAGEAALGTVKPGWSGSLLTVVSLSFLKVWGCLVMFSF